MKKMNLRFDSVAVHDGQAWRLLTGKGGAATFRSSREALPQELVDAASSSGRKRMLFLVSSDLHVIDGAIPKNAGMEKVESQLKSAISEATGVEQDGALVAGMTTAWGGVRKPFTVAFSFDGDAAGDFHAALEEAGIACAGFASLELAILALWRRRVTGRQALAVVTEGRSFIVPAQRGANPGPQTVPCGLRHFTADEENWRTRFVRAAASLDRNAPLHLIVLDSEGRENAVARALDAAGFANVVVEQAEAWLVDSAKEAYAAKPNRCRAVTVPVTNPWEPRKVFSNGWIVAAALLVLALPAGYRLTATALSDARCKELAAETASLKPKADVAKAANARLANARAALASEKVSQKSLVEMRRPLVAFLDIAYFFCRHAGNSIVLRDLTQSESQVVATGVFSDPEDSAILNTSVLEYAKERNISVVEKRSEHVGDGADSSLNSFRIVFDCSKAGEDAE